MADVFASIQDSFSETFENFRRTKIKRQISKLDDLANVAKRVGGGLLSSSLLSKYPEEETDWQDERRRYFRGNSANKYFRATASNFLGAASFDSVPFPGTRPKREQRLRREVTVRIWWNLGRLGHIVLVTGPTITNFSRRILQIERRVGRVWSTDWKCDGTESRQGNSGTSGETVPLLNSLFSLLLCSFAHNGYGDRWLRTHRVVGRCSF